MTCANMKASSITDTSFTDCVIGGLMGPDDFSCCNFNASRYSRTAHIVTVLPYTVFSSENGPFYIYKTNDSWHVHEGKKRKSFSVKHKVPATSPYAPAIDFIERTIKRTEAKAKNVSLEIL